MDDLITFAITVFTGFFAIMNPISNMPIFLTLTEGADKETKQRINLKAVIIAFIIVTTFVLLGNYIFDLFGITIPAFKITGGILIFFVGFEMLQSKKSNIKRLKTVNYDENIAISPLAIPILAGPGTIVTATNFVANTSSYLSIGVIIFVFALMCLLNYIAFSLSDIIAKKIGDNVISVIGKLMGLIIAIIGTNMIIQGIKLSFDIMN
ncbi:multiple antibiotic resistance (marC)-related protein [Nonlabens ulvanivorans]|nr:MarC family protein [Nonlabens ulvanivorans]GAK93200.1 multiple antibiotic resistance (marC)-related protein [Nonlabens ulvanivorans]|tara:strand:+ start:236 stop:859 length:624 start_codon:yes stop_codon:yes gene_type:complete